MTPSKAAALAVRLKAFEAELDALCGKHDVTLVPEDSHGSTHVYFGPSNARDMGGLALALPWTDYCEATGPGETLWGAQVRFRTRVVRRAKSGARVRGPRPAARQVRAMRLLAYWGRNL